MGHFVFPNLTTFKLLPFPTQDFSVSCLLDFLKVSPLLQTVEMNIIAEINLRSVPREMVVVLPNVKIFSLHVVDYPKSQVYGLASHISCPCANHTSLTHSVRDNGMSPSLEVFPTLAGWNTIVHKYSAIPVEEVTRDKTLSRQRDRLFPHLPVPPAQSLLD